MFKYRVTKEDGIEFDGETYSKDATIELSESQAQQFIDRAEIVKLEEAAGEGGTGS